MVDRKIILDTYKKGPEAVISLFEETFSKLEKRIQELENASKKNSKNRVLVQRKDTFPRNNEDSYWNHSLRC
ncbi:hypothetical protein BLX06_31205 [Bacillus cereus]|uniref:Uncharacterized protein n=1 Tax=Bacillus cereus TaxID=1396 RepID=A0A9X6B3G9_BACCE|nr:hypothetical protein [Bacillus cereus]OOR71364.1 hypothetical protein BLX06_31205 [Bacillus cereus]